MDAFIGILLACRESVLADFHYGGLCDLDILFSNCKCCLNNGQLFQLTCDEYTCHHLYVRFLTYVQLAESKK